MCKISAQSDKLFFKKKIFLKNRKKSDISKTDDWPALPKFQTPFRHLRNICSKFQPDRTYGRYLICLDGQTDRQTSVF